MKSVGIIQSTTQKIRIYWPEISVFAGLFVFFFLRLAAASVFKGFWADESDGLYTANSAPSIWDLILHGSHGASPSPLYYIIDRVWYAIGAGAPVSFVDMRLYMRLPHILYWTIASIAVGVFLYRQAYRELQSQRLIALILAVGGCLFFHSNMLGHAYAIEERAYSLWVMGTTLQYAFMLTLLRRPLDGIEWFIHYLVCLILIFTTYVSYTQIFISFFVLHAVWGIKSERSRAGLKTSILFLTLLLPFVLHYHSLSFKMGFSPGWFTLERYLDSLYDVTLKTFHMHHRTGLIFLVPAFFILLPWRARKNKQILFIWLSTILLYLLSAVFFKGSQRSGGIWATRYVIYLIPTLFAIYAAALVNFLLFLGFKLEAKVPRIIAGRASLLLLWAILEIVTRTYSYASILQKDFKEIQKRPIFGWSKHTECYLKTTDYYKGEIMTVFLAQPMNLEGWNDYCRGILPEYKPHPVP